MTTTVSKAVTKVGLVVQDGISSKSTYVVLARNPEKGIHLGLRPFVFRVDDNTIWLGGRLRTAFDFDGYDHQTKNPKMKVLSLAKSRDVLKKEFPGFQWHREDARRCSTTIGIMIAVGAGDGRAFQKMWNKTDYIGALLDEIQVKVKRPLEGTQGVKAPKDKYMKALTSRYETEMKFVFATGGVKLGDKILGDISNLMNQGASRGYKSSKAAFLKSVAKEQAKATA